MIEPHTKFRFQLTLVGLCAGLSAYGITEILRGAVENQRFTLFIAAFAYAGFSALLLLAGSMVWRKTALYAISHAGLCSLLFLWASFRFETVGVYLSGDITPLFVFYKLVILPLPFFMAYENADKTWRDYPFLFQCAWSLFVKICITFLFLGIFWAVLLSSTYLLTFVELDFLQDWLEEEFVWMPLSGAVFGLGLAALNELNAVVDIMRSLAVRLLRLLLPIIAVVTAIFLVFIPVRGLDTVFGEFSAATTILCMTGAGIALITATLDAVDEKGSQNAVLLGCARVLAVLLPIMAGVALYAFYLRVNQYGWTPERLAGAASAGVVFAYAFTYVAACFIKPSEWRQSIRQGNIYLALGVIGISVLWLTPLLNTQRISANTQIARYLAEKSVAEQLPIWEMQRDWGRAGKAAVQTLHTRAAKDQTLAKVLEDSKSFDTNRAFTKAQQEKAKQEKLKDLQAMITVLPDAAQDVAGYFEVLEDWKIKELSRNCKTPEKCVLLIEDFNTDYMGKEALFFYPRDRNSHIVDIGFFKKRPSFHHGRKMVFEDVSPFDSTYQLTPDTWPAFYQKLKSGEYELVPSGLRSLKIGDKTITPGTR